MNALVLESRLPSIAVDEVTRGVWGQRLRPPGSGIYKLLLQNSHNWKIYT